MCQLVPVRRRKLTVRPRMSVAVLPLLIFGCTSSGVLDGTKPPAGRGGTQGNTGGSTGAPIDATSPGGAAPTSTGGWTPTGGTAPTSTGGWTSTGGTAPTSTGGTTP